MYYLKFIKIIIVFVSILIASGLYGEVDHNSIFGGARYPASILDLELYKKEIGWLRRYVLSPTEIIRKWKPLITKARVVVHLSYRKDKIVAEGWVTNLKGFLSLTKEERKQLVRNILDELASGLLWTTTIVDKNTGDLSHALLQKRDITLNIILDDPVENQKGEKIRLFLPLSLGVGQAGYKDEQYVFSEDYYLKLKVIGDKAKTGDPSKFAIERDKQH
jgi:hypothetical protein